MDRPVLEREDQLAELARAARDAAAGNGCVVLVHGEAGIGKSSLVEAARAGLPAEGRLLVGRCDDLSTARTLGPFRDLVGSVGTELAQALTSGDDREQVFSALLHELDRAGRPTVLAVEDVHWADDATLDTLRFLARRISTLPAVLLLTYRDDEVGGDHPVQRLLGSLPPGGTTRRLPLPRLSAEAVRRLSAGADVDPARVYAVSSGNPFFVTEVLASAPSRRVPGTVVDAVRSRVRTLAPATRTAVEQLAVVPTLIERWLVDALVQDGIATLAEAEERGLLVVSAHRVGFRHELTRRAVLDALPAARRAVLQRRVLEVLLGRGGVDVARLVHHAGQAGDVEAILRYGPPAARDASRNGGHREAAAHYRVVLQHAEALPPDERARYQGEYAVECYTLGLDECAPAQALAVELHRRLGDAAALGAALRWLSRMHWFTGDRAAAEAAAQEATDVLQDAGDAGLLALAVSNRSQLAMLAHRHGEAADLARRAIAMARDLGDVPLLSHGLTNLGLARWLSGDAGGRADLEEAARSALEVGDVEDGCRAYIGIVWSLLDEYRLDDADEVLRTCTRIAEDAEFDGFHWYMQGERARLELARSRPEEAEAAAALALHGSAPARCVGLTVLGTLHARLGRPDADALLDRAKALADPMQEIQRSGPIAAARAEAAWLRGDRAAALEVAGTMHATAVRVGDGPLRAELAARLRTLGRPVDEVPGDLPFALQARGAWREAADAWEARGCPYHRAAALAEGDEPDALLEALTGLDRLGALPLARIVRGRLRDLGVSGVPRGPQPSTRADPAGLTVRQREVLAELVQGRTNAEIARRLVISVRTADHHVSAVLDKLGVRHRAEAAAAAHDLGLVDES